MPNDIETVALDQNTMSNNHKSSFAKTSSLWAQQCIIAHPSEVSFMVDGSEDTDLASSQLDGSEETDLASSQF